MLASNLQRCCVTQFFSGGPHFLNPKGSWDSQNFYANANTVTATQSSLCNLEHKSYTSNDLTID